MNPHTSRRSSFGESGCAATSIAFVVGSDGTAGSFIMRAGLSSVGMNLSKSSLTADGTSTVIIRGDLFAQTLAK
jgi:hypothetical protein